jgi:C1A family cysteine protease
MTSSLAPRKVAGYGWVPDLPDARDLMFAAAAPVLAALPPAADLTAQCPPVYNQGQIGSCTANAIGAAFEYDLMRQGLPNFVPSRLFIYYNERAMEGHTAYDSGAAIRDGVKSVNKLGVCDESDWPYDDTPASTEGGPFPPDARDGERPPAHCYAGALKNKATAYKRVQRDLDHMRACLASGFPFVFGFTVYESFESREVASTGVVPLPGPTERTLGGHAVLAVGYNDADQRFIVRNSWGTAWGQKGYFTIPYEYLTNRGLASDFWTISTVS